MMRTPDGHSKLELPGPRPRGVRPKPENPPPNTLGLHRVLFAVDDIDDTVARQRAHGAELLGGGAYESISGSATSAAPRASSSPWPNRSADASLPRGAAGVIGDAPTRPRPPASTRTPTDAATSSNAASTGSSNGAASPPDTTNSPATAKQLHPRQRPPLDRQMIHRTGPGPSPPGPCRLGATPGPRHSARKLCRWPPRGVGSRMSRASPGRR